MKNFILIISLCFTLNLVAQKNNYWSTSFNTEASLLAGAVVGGNSDLTSIYYNPAGISEIKDMKLSLNANLFNYSIVDYKNALGSDVDIKDYYFLVKPRFISYLYRSKRDTNLSWQFAIYNKLLDDITIYNTVKYNGNILYKEIEESYNGNFDMNSYLYDYRGGIGTSYMFNDRFSAGISLIGMIKGIDYLKAIDVSVYPRYTPVSDTNYYFANWNYYEKIYMYDVRMLARIGFRYKFNQIQVGLVTTLPSFKLWGNSDSKRRISQSNVENDSISYPNYIKVESSIYLESQMKDPFSVAFGIVYSTKDEKSKLYFSTEYFAGIDEYKMIDGTKSVEDENFVGSDFLTHYYATIPIMNFGFGYKHLFSETIEGLMGFKTDFDATKIIEKEFVDKEIPISLNQNHLNLYHLTSGVKMNVKKGSFIVGLEYIFGYVKNLPQYANFKDVNYNGSKELLGLQGQINDNMSIAYNSFGLYLGFSFGF